MLCNQGRDHASRQHFGKRFVAIADVAVAEMADKRGPTHTEHSGALQDEPA